MKKEGRKRRGIGGWGRVLGDWNGNIIKSIEIEIILVFNKFKAGGGEEVML